MDKVHFSSKSESWETPKDFFNKYNLIYSFTLDVCADASNKKVERFFSKEEDGLSKDWSNDVCWMNPPYGRGIYKWMQKAYEESLKGAIVVCLIPSRTDTKWWHDFAVKGDITFIKGRLKFNNCKNPAPFPSAVVVFNG